MSYKPPSYKEHDLHQSPNPHPPTFHFLDPLPHYSPVPRAPAAFIPPSVRITLQVGERTFHTTHKTLTSKGGFFARILPDPNETPTPEEPQPQLPSTEVWFLDHDPDIFAHVLRYLRDGIFPVLADSAGRLDYAGYKALNWQACGLGLEELRKSVVDLLGCFEEYEEMSVVEVLKGRARGEGRRVR